SDYVCSAILSQPDKDGHLHPVAFHSKKMSPAECNYEIYDKELLAIIQAFRVFRQYLEGAKYRIRIITDHKNLQYFMETKQLTRRQARWALLLGGFDFEIEYRPGKQGLKPDALTRRPQDRPKEGDERIEFNNRILLGPDKFVIGAMMKTEVKLTDTLPMRIKKKLMDDPIAKEIVEQLQKKERFSKHISLAQCELEDGYLHYDGLIYVPNNHELKMEILKSCHDDPVAGHPGVARTFEMITRNYHWPGLRKFVQTYVANCDACARAKSSRQKPYGILKPLELPRRPWEDISMDHITGLPESENYDAILVVVDRLTKMAHYIPSREDDSANTLARRF